MRASVGDGASVMARNGTASNATAEPAGLLLLLVHGLATFRLVKLVRDDKITEPVREAVQSRWGKPEESRVSYLMDCPWCLSIYFGAGLTLLHRRWPRRTGVLARALALSAMTGLAAQHLDH